MIKIQVVYSDFEFYKIFCQLFNLIPCKADSLKKFYECKRIVVGAF